MGERFNKSGAEEGIKWSVEHKEENVFKITVVNTETDERAEEEYSLMYNPVFGMDIEDSNNIDAILSKLITQLQ